MPAVIARSILPMSGLSSSRQASDSAPPERSSSATSAPRSRWASTSDLSIVAVGRALGADQLEADAGGVAAEADDDRPGGAHGGLDVEHRARVDVDEQDLALGHQRQADLERGGAGAGVEGEERVVGLGGGDQLGPAQLDRAQLAAHQRLAAVGLAAGEVDDRLEVRRHLAVGEELGEPVGARAVEQRVGRDRQALLVVELDREQAGALGVRDRAQQVLQAVLPAGAGELEALDRDVALDRLGRVVLELVEHGRTVRQKSHAVSGLVGLPYRVHLGSIGGNAAPLDQRAALYVVRRRPRGPSRPAPPNAFSASSRAQSSPSSSEKWVSRTRCAPARRACSPASAGRDVAARALALGPRQRGLDHEQVGVAREVDDVVGRGVVGAVGDAAAAVGAGDLDRVGRRRSAGRAGSGSAAARR